MPTPEFWIVAGPNGAGKTTLVQAEPIRTILPHVTFLNPDDVAKQHLAALGVRSFSDAPEATLQEAFVVAADDVFARLNRVLEAGGATGVETVLSSDKYKPVVEVVRDRAGFLGLIYVWLESPELACARVARRMSRGGHDVRREKIISRWHRSLDNLPWFLKRVSRFWIYDNSNSDPEVPPKLVAVGGDGQLEFLSSVVPAAIERVLRS